MSTSLLLPTAPTTLVIVLGASAWPNSPGFQPSQAFVHAAQGFRAYVLDPHGLGLPPSNLLDLFDAQTSASDQLETLSSFLEEQIQTRKGTNQAVRDVLISFVGHGGFAGPAADFYLLHRRANASSLRATGMAIDALAEVVREKARQVRRYLFLDCCFAAASFRAFQGGPDQTAITKTLDAFHVQAQSSGFPQRGTVLFCSSNQKTPSQLLPDESSTMFSSALLDVLRYGDRSRSLQLSLRDLKELVENRLAGLPGQNAPRPGLYSPDQSDGDAADIPFFPNPRTAGQHSRPLFLQEVKQVSPSPNPSAAPLSATPSRLRAFSGGKSMLLLLLLLLIVGGGSFFFLRTVPLTQTPQTLYTQITQAHPTLDDPLRVNDNNNWTETRPADPYSCRFSGGEYHVNAPFTPCLAQATTFGDLAYQVQMTIVQGEMGGIVFRADSSQTKYYTFFIDRSGHYTLIASVDRTTVNDRTLSEGTSASIKTGLNQANLLTVIAQGRSISLYINRQFIASASDSTYRDGHIGVFGGNQSQAPADVIFSQVQVWRV